MASVLSVDAQEFIPGTGLVVGSKPKLCSSLSVDAPVFVPWPVVTTENQKENSFSASTGKQGNKSSTVQRRGRFAQTDSRTQPNQKNNDVFGKTPTLIKKENSGGKNLKLQSTVDHSGNKNEFPAKEGGDKKKLKQSFSLEYSKRRKHATSRDLDNKIIRDSDGDIQTNKTPPNFSCNSSGESKPIILWSSIVKQEPNKEKSEEDNINQKTSLKTNTVTVENTVSTKKYSKNKVTRTKNVLSEPPNDKYGHRTISEWKRKDMKDEDLLKGINKPISVEFPKFVTGTDELLNNKSPNNLPTEVGVSNTIITYKPSPVIKNTKRRNKEKGEKPGVNGDPEKPNYDNFNCEPDYSRNYVQSDSISDISNVKREKRNDSKANLRKSQDEWLDNKGNVKNNTIKKLNNSERSLNEANNVSNKALNNNQLLKLSQNSNNVIPDEKSENIKSLNLSDNSSFPALAKGNVPTIIPPLSYSAVAKKIIPVNTNPIISNEKKNINAMYDVQFSEEEKRVIKKQQKALKRKLKVKQRKQEAKMDKPKQGVIEKTSERKSDKEMTFDLSDMFTKLLKVPSLEKKSQKSVKSKKVKMSTGVISVVSGLAKKNTPDGRRVERNKYGTTHTIMDGNTPIRKRGKERETPKKKRPTLLKKVITAERERKRVLLEKNKSSGVDISKDVPLLEVNITDIEKPNVEKVEYISEFPEDIWKKIHSKKFREYCDHVLTKEINQLTYNLLVTLQKFQDRVYHENPTKYKQKRRFILGLREVLKHLKLKRLKAVIIAPNIERISSKGGLDDYLGSIISICNEQDIPKIFAMNRHVLGRVIKKLAPVSVVGVFDYDGAHDIFKELVDHVQLANVAYMEKVNELHGDNKNKESDVSPQKTVISNYLDSTDNKEHLGQNNGVDKVRQQMLNKLYVDEYRSYDGESESDAWVTDTESTPL